MLHRREWDRTSDTVRESGHERSKNRIGALDAAGGYLRRRRRGRNGRRSGGRRSKPWFRTVPVDSTNRCCSHSRLHAACNSTDISNNGADYALGFPGGSGSNCRDDDRHLPHAGEIGLLAGWESVGDVHGESRGHFPTRGRGDQVRSCVGRRGACLDEKREGV